MDRTLGELFCGGGGFTCGAVAAGLRPIFGIECDPDIAQVYARNFGPHVIVSTVEEVDYSTLQTPYHLHASPSCKKASIANKERGESIEDTNAAEGTARAIRTLLPLNFSLENVWGYREFESFKIILRALSESGYAFDFWHLNSADFGVPQTRKRLILIASRTHKPRRPQQTHTEHPSAQVSMFSSPLLKWNGWYKAIEDLIPTLPESKFAAWQLKRLPESIARGVLIDGRNTGQEYGKLHRADCEPSITVTVDGRPSHMPRAFIVEGTAAGRAFIVDCQDAGTPDENGERKLTVRDSDAPTFTVSASMAHRPARAFLIGGANTSETQAAEGAGVSEEGEPSRCVNASNSAHWRAWLSQGRVVSMTPRALARFQSISDSFFSGSTNGLACRVIGNAVPSLLGQRIIESVEAAEEIAA